MGSLDAGVAHLVRAVGRAVEGVKQPAWQFDDGAVLHQHA